MKVKKLEIEGPALITPKKNQDRRGVFREIWGQSAGIPQTWKQVNHSYTIRGGLRGLHYRPGEAKLVTVVKGYMSDFVVDIRPDSETFGAYLRIKMDVGDQLYIPSGFAHGFTTTSNSGVDVVYLTNQIYDPKLAKGIAWDDPTLGIEWDISGPIVSDQDRNNPSWKEYLKSVENLDSGKHGNAGNSVQ